jgi:hypothetical protein
MPDVVVAGLVLAKTLLAGAETPAVMLKKAASLLCLRPMAQSSLKLIWQIVWQG